MVDSFEDLSRLAMLWHMILYCRIGLSVFRCRITHADHEWLGDEANEAHAVVREGGSTSKERGRECNERG